MRPASLSYASRSRLQLLAKVHILKLLELGFHLTIPGQEWARHQKDEVFAFSNQCNHVQPLATMCHPDLSSKGINVFLVPCPPAKPGGFSHPTLLCAGASPSGVCASIVWAKVKVASVSCGPNAGPELYEGSSESGGLEGWTS